MINLHHVFLLLLEGFTLGDFTTFRCIYGLKIASEKLYKSTKNTQCKSIEKLWKYTVQIQPKALKTASENPAKSTKSHSVNPF